MTVACDLWVIVWVTFPSGPASESVVITILSLHLLCIMAFFFIFFWRETVLECVHVPQTPFPASVPLSC